MNHTLIILSVVMHTLLAALTFLVYQNGLIHKAWESDPSWVTTAMVVSLGLVYPFIIRDTVVGSVRNVEVYDFVAVALLTLGFIGTVYGMMIALDGLNPAELNVETVGEMVGQLMVGVRLAFSTTMVGMVFWLIVSANSALIWRVANETEK